VIDAVRKHQQKSGMHTRLGLALFFSLFARLISHQPAVLFSQNEPATSNQSQPASSTLLSEQTSTSHQPPANRTGRLFELGEPLRPYRVSGTNKKPIFVVLNPQPPFVSIFFPSWRCQCNAYLVWVRKACDAMPR
jgi:hypothetical protein